MTGTVIDNQPEEFKPRSKKTFPALVNIANAYIQKS
jgi:hypothetical protein